MLLLSHLLIKIIRTSIKPLSGPTDSPLSGPLVLRSTSCSYVATSNIVPKHISYSGGHMYGYFSASPLLSYASLLSSLFVDR